MNALQKLIEGVANRHRYAREWKQRTGGKVVGYMCTYIPEEIVYAAGALPVRLLGSHQPEDVTAPHIPNFFCSYSRDCVAQGLLGKYDYLDGVIAPHGCYQIRQAYAVWRRQIPTEYGFYFFMPTLVQNPRAKDALVKEALNLKTSLESWLGRPVAEASLKEAIATYNVNRRLLQQLYRLRQAAPPPFTGSEVLQVVLAAQVMDKAEHSRWLRELMAQLPPRAGQDDRVRLMVVGSISDDVQLLELVESLGGEIVVDDHCAGSRYFWGEAAEDGDALSALAQRYLDRPACPLYDQPQRRRPQHVLSLAKDYRVQGALMVHLKFCDPHEYDLPYLGRLLKDNGISCLSVECDITIPAGQLRTRIEAFLETIHQEG